MTWNNITKPVAPNYSGINKPDTPIYTEISAPSDFLLLTNGSFLLLTNGYFLKLRKVLPNYTNITKPV